MYNINIEIENETLYTICFALAKAIERIAKAADVSTSELLQDIKIAICINKIRGNKYEQPDESL